MDVRYPSADQFVRTVVAGSILARMGIEVNDDILQELCSYVSDALTQYETGSGLVVPMESYLASSVK